MNNLMLTAFAALCLTVGVAPEINVAGSNTSGRTRHTIVRGDNSTIAGGEKATRMPQTSSYSP
jgi:hypothetical protein